MKEDTLDKALRIQTTVESEIEYLWAVDAKEFCKAFGLEASSSPCRHCKKPVKPFLPFYFRTDDGETVVGVIGNHLDCTNVNGSNYNHSIMMDIDEDSEFNKMTRDLFQAFQKPKTYVASRIASAALKGDGE